MKPAAALPACSRGEIWMVDFEPRLGSKQGGVRPAVIVQTDLGNHAPGARTTIVVPLTTQGRPFAFYVPITKTRMNGLAADSWANCTQLFALDKARLARRLGIATPAQMNAIGAALRDTLELGAP